MRKELYEWQEECIKRWFENNGRGIVQAVTGAGKTYLALTAAARIEEKAGRNFHVKIIVPTGALMQQWNRALREFLSDSCTDGVAPANLRNQIGLRGCGSNSASDCKYMIYVINSARYELARQILAELKQGDAVLLIADECHHYASDQNKLIFEFLPYIKPYENHFFSLGLSATLPSGEPRRYLTAVLGRKIYDYGMEKASLYQTICPYDVYHISLAFFPSEKAEYEELSDRMMILYRRLLQACPSLAALGQKERYELLRHLSGDKNRKIAEMASLYMRLSFKRKSLVCLASARIACTCDLIARLDDSEKIIIFSERTKQADELYQLLQKSYPEKVGRYHSKMGKWANRNVLDRFREGSVRILIACKAIDEGIDVPDASVGIIMSGTSTQRQRIQRLGRIIRKNNRKERSALYYLHITETSEDSCFLPDAASHRLFELTYDSLKHHFTNPAYDEKALSLLSDMQNAHVGEEKLREAARCLQLGCIRADWLLEQDAIEEHIKKAKYISEKNYWVCMKKLSFIDRPHK